MLRLIDTLTLEELNGAKKLTELVTLWCQAGKHKAGMYQGYAAYQDAENFTTDLLTRIEYATREKQNTGTVS